MAKSIVAVILIILIIGGIAGYLFYTRYVQGTVTLNITDPPQAPPGNSHQYDPSIMHIFVTFSTIQIHRGGLGNPGNDTWATIVGSPRTIDMISVVTSTQVLGTTRLSTGTYDQLRFPVASALVTFSKIGNVTYAVPSDSLRVSIDGGGFESSPGSNVGLLLTISFNDNEILAMNGHLTPRATAQVTA